MWWQILFWLSIFCLFHTYALFPFILSEWAKRRRLDSLIYEPLSPQLPFISILLAAYNEEKVIERKIETTLRTSYPLNKIEFLIGSDASIDSTNNIVRNLQRQFPQIRLVEFSARTGKVGIINALAEQAKGEIFVLTDANVFFKEDTLYQLTKHYRNPEIGLVGGNIQNYRVKRDGISIQEKQYLSRENLIKYQEGIIWGTMMGVFGGCYSLRARSYASVPARFCVDDFYLTMHVLEDGLKTINEPDALCYEDVSNKISEEFRRKVRISIGNFQNLVRFVKLLWPFQRQTNIVPKRNGFRKEFRLGLAFSFLSHKVLRWLGPFFIVLSLLSSSMLASQTLFFRIALWGQAFLILIPALDLILRRLHIHFFMLRLISHFYLMNLALLIGFLKYVRGVESNIWKPTQRYQ